MPSSSDFFLKISFDLLFLRFIEITESSFVVVGRQEPRHSAVLKLMVREI